MSAEQVQTFKKALHSQTMIAIQTSEEKGSRKANVRDGSGRTPLMLAAIFGHLDATMVILKSTTTFPLQFFVYPNAAYIPVMLIIFLEMIFLWHTVVRH